MKIQKWQIIEVAWLDSLHKSGWMEERDVTITSKKDMTHYSVGYFWGEDEKSILFVQSRNTDQVDAVMEIPKRAIIKMRKIKSRWL